MGPPRAEEGLHVQAPRPHTPVGAAPPAPLANSELLRRTRRRLAMVGSGRGSGRGEDRDWREGDVTPGPAATLVDKEAEEDDETLGRIYFLRTRLSGRRLLRAWGAWRSAHEGA